MDKVDLGHADKRISISGVNAEKEQMLVSEIMNARNSEEIERRVHSYREKGATKIVVVLPCSSVYSKSIKNASDSQISRFSNLVFKTLSS